MQSSENLNHESLINAISAVSLITRDMSRAVRFYRSLGFELRFGGEGAAFTSFAAGRSYLNLIYLPGDVQPCAGWGRVIFHVENVDDIYTRAVSHGLQPSASPHDAEWGERFFHLSDPDGHELSFAKPLSSEAILSPPFMP